MGLINYKRPLNYYLFYFSVGILFLIFSNNTYANNEVDVCKKDSWREISTIKYSQSEMSCLRETISS